MPNTLRVGLVGYGFAGKTFHAPLLGTTPGLTLAAIASSKPDVVLADWPEATVYPTPEALIAAPDIDLIVIATPNDTHAPLAQAALAAGKHVVVDKPFTLTVAEAEALQAQAAQVGRVLSVFHNRRWDADFLGLQQLLASGRLGRVTELTSRFDRYRPEVRQRWREAAVVGAGIWYDLGPHLIDQALTLFGLPDAISADLALRRDGAQAVDDALAVLHYPDKRVVLGASCLVSGGVPRYLVHGTLGSFEKYGLDVQEDQMKAGGMPGMDDWGHDPRPGRLHGWSNDQAVVEDLHMPAGDYPQYYAGVRDAINGVGPNPVTPEQAIAVMRMIEAGTLASETGQRVALK